jgi:phosphate transport system substrate-binding protein
MGLRKSILSVICLYLLSGCGHGKKENITDADKIPESAELSGVVAVRGAYALTPLANAWAESFMKIHNGVRVEVSESGTGSGISELLQKKVQLAMISRPLTDEEKEAGIMVFPVAKDGVAPIVNSKNPYLGRLLDRGLSPEELQKAFTGESIKWNDLLDTTGNDKIKVFARADESGAADVLAKFLYKNPADFKGTRVNGDVEMIKSVQSDPLALGFCNFSYAFSDQDGSRTENIQIIPFDLDFDNKIDRKEIPFRNLAEAHRSVWLGVYPEMLCRELTLGSLGKPTDPAVIEFLKYVLTNGQDEVQNAGLCPLNNVYVRYSLEMLE